MKTYRISYDIGLMREGADYIAQCPILALQQFCHDIICDDNYDFEDVKNILIIEV